MSVNIEWQSNSNKWHDTDGQSRHASALRRMFGHPDEGLVFTLDHSMLERLRGLDLGETDSSFWLELIQAIEEHDSITVRLAY